LFQNPSLEQWIGWPVFILVTIGMVYIFRKNLSDPRHFSFYRFLAFETLIAILFLNIRSWMLDPFSPHHLLSWVLLFLAAAVAANSLILLKREGQPVGNIVHTTRMVSTGIYKYIRHPLYTSLILLAWAIYLKNPRPLSTTLIFTACGLLAATAIVEEQQNIEKFGEAYRLYMDKTRRFLPFVF
jgi:protein-S-isoprenylcysteine O-methyltransferase Ste14